jgi:hypothetical protein
MSDIPTDLEAGAAADAAPVAKAESDQLLYGSPGLEPSRPKNGCAIMEERGPALSGA